MPLRCKSGKGGDEGENAIRRYRFAMDLDPTFDFARDNLRKMQGKGEI